MHIFWHIADIYLCKHIILKHLSYIWTRRRLKELLAVRSQPDLSSRNRYKEPARPQHILPWDSQQRPAWHQPPPAGSPDRALEGRARKTEDVVSKEMEALRIGIECIFNQYVYCNSKRYLKSCFLVFKMLL